MDITLRTQLSLFTLLTDRLTLSAYHKGLLNRLQLYTVKDVLFHIPHSVQTRRFFHSIQDLKSFYQTPSHLSVKGGFIGEVVAHEISKSRHVPNKVVVKDNTSGMEIVFFNMKPIFLHTKLPVGRRFAFGGTINSYLGRIHMVQPDAILDPIYRHNLEHNERIYGLTKGLNQSFFQKVIPYLLKEIPEIPEWDDDIVHHHGWPSWSKAIVKLHQANSNEDLMPMTPARQRLAYDELLAHQLSMLLMKHAYHKSKGIPKISQHHKLQNAIALLPFQLTDGQMNALHQILKDLRGPHQMHRLLQGDVGSGKTVVALLAMIHAVDAGFQTTLLAPTDILARQHFSYIQPFCDALGIHVALFTGRDKTKERTQNNEGLSSGNIHIAIGTHALIQDSIHFKNLGFAVIDEQHKFGVAQRSALLEKGQSTDTLFMSATPIPRTVVLARYGDLDVSVIKEKPAGRKEIHTLAMPTSKEHELMMSLSRSVQQGNQIYWVCPLIEESEDLDLMAAEKRYTALCEALPDYRIGLVHGRMKSKDKDDVMMAFKQGTLDILVSTTVIEVGVDVPNATLMVIEHAERFGLAQLHQLRGRIGRGHKTSTCILLYTPDNLSQIAQDRLTIMKETNDGFRIAEEDLKLRGGGEIAGTKQSGFPDYKFADPLEHGYLMEKAYDQAHTLLTKNPDLNDALRLLLKLYDREDALHYVHSG